MAAYGALVSVMHIMDNLQNHPRPPITIDKAQTQSLTQKIAFLQDFLESYHFHGAREELESLQSRIADVAHAPEDVIESHIVDQIYARGGTDIQRLRKLMKVMRFIKRKLKEIIKEKVDIKEQTHNHPCPPITLDEKQVESEKIAMLRDFVKYYNSCEVRCLLRRISADNSIGSETVNQIITEKIGILRTLFRAYNSYGDECLQIHIACAANATEDNIVFHLVDLNRGLSIDTHGNGQHASTVDFYQRLQKVIEDMDLIEREVKERRNKVEFKDRLHITVKETVVSSRSPSKEQNIMVGFDDVFFQILDKLKGQRSDRRIILIVGMGGIGKTTLARNVYESTLVEQHFDISSWVTISQEYNVEDVISEILSLKDKRNMATSSGTREGDLGLQLHKHLWGRRYLIILDDMWSTDVWDKLKNFFPENNCGSRIIVTTRLSNLALELSGTKGLEIGFLDEESSWTLLSKTVFGEEGCLDDGLEEIGKKIAGNCKGLPLSIVVIGGLLAKCSSVPAYWEYVARNLNSFVNLEDGERCYKTLHTSYDFLPTHLKPCFLYMGIYPEDHEICVSDLIKLWVAEGFLKPINGKSLEVAAREYLMDLIDRNLILVRRLGTSSGKVKSCTIHDLLRDLCVKQARKEKFLYVKTRNGLISEDVTTQRHFAINASTSTEVHFSKKVAFQFASLARSFIFDFASYNFDLFGVLPSPNSRLLRVLNVVHACLSTEPRARYNFDAVFDDYVNLRRLAIHCSWHNCTKVSFPPSVYHLWNLQTLIVGGSGCCIAAAPPEIWKMPLLKHVKLPQLYLPDPPGSNIDREGDEFVLWNLQTLSTVCNLNFGNGAAKRIPNVQKLKLWYEDFEPEFEVASHYFLNNLGSLHKLESLGCFFDFFSNFGFAYGPSRSDLLPNLSFPHSLRKLSLQGTWFNWEDMSTTIGPLPLLEVLKLGQVSFTGPQWETIEGQFCNLRFMQIDSCYGLKHWITESTHFPRLEHLVLRQVDCLEEIPSCIGEISMLQSMKLEHCCYSAVISAKAIQEAQEESGNESFKVQVLSCLIQEYEVMKGLATPNFQVECEELNMMLRKSRRRLG